MLRDGLKDEAYFTKRIAWMEQTIIEQEELSLAVLLDIRPSEICELTDKIRVEEFDDYLANYLLLYIDKDWKFNSQSFIFPRTYEELKTIIEDKENSKAQLLQGYLTKRWYRNHHDAYWYDSHKSKFDIYSGYWSYEAGAISKILKLDDSCLKGVKYYPYDLVHGDD